MVGIFIALVAIALAFFLYQPWQAYKGLAIDQWLTVLSNGTSKGLLEAKCELWSWWFRNRNLPLTTPTLKLTQITTGSEPGRYTFEISLYYDLLTNYDFVPVDKESEGSGMRHGTNGRLRLVIDHGPASLLGDYGRASDGKILLFWYVHRPGVPDGSDFKPGLHRIHAYFLIVPSRSGGASTMEAVGPDIVVTVPTNPPVSKP